MMTILPPYGELPVGKVLKLTTRKICNTLKRQSIVTDYMRAFLSSENIVVQQLIQILLWRNICDIRCINNESPYTSRVIMIGERYRTYC